MRSYAYNHYPQRYRLLEDIEDLEDARERLGEPSLPFEQLAELKDEGLL